MTRWLAPLLVLPALAACSKDAALLERTVTPVDPAGGVARSADGLATLRFPSGALRESTDITILTVRGGADARLRSLTYELGPEGVDFGAPVVLEIDVQRSAEDVRLVQVVGGALEAVAGSTWDRGAHVVSAPLPHFSSYAAEVVTATPTPDGGELPPPDGGVTRPSNEANAGGPCWSNDECPSGWTCVFWDDQCRIGRCDEACPTTFDAVALTICGCDGIPRLGDRCTDFAFSTRGVVTATACPVFDGPWLHTDAGP